MTVRIRFDEIYVRHLEAVTKMVENPLFKAMVETWRLMDASPGVPVEATPYYEALSRLQDAERADWNVDKEGLGGFVKSFCGMYLTFRGGGYAPERTGEYPVVKLRDGRYVLCDGLNRLSMLCALGWEEAEFAVAEDCYPYYTPYVHPITDEHLRELVEAAHRHQPLYAPYRIVDQPMNLYLPINHPLYRDAVCSRFDTPLRLQLMLKEVGDPAGKRFLDIGSNTGWFCIELALRGARCVGVDSMKEYTDIASFMAAYYGLAWNGGDRQRRVWFYPMTVERYLSETEEKFDYVIFTGLFHHLLKESPAGAWETLRKLSSRAPVMFFGSALEGEPQMEGRDAPTEQGIIGEVIAKTLYTDGKLLSRGFIRDWKDRHIRPDLPLRPMYVFWRDQS